MLPRKILRSIQQKTEITKKCIEIGWKKRLLKENPELHLNNERVKATDAVMMKQFIASEKKIPETHIRLVEYKNNFFFSDHITRNTWGEGSDDITVSHR